MIQDVLLHLDALATASIRCINRCNRLIGCTPFPFIHDDDNIIVLHVFRLHRLQVLLRLQHVVIDPEEMTANVGKRCCCQWPSAYQMTVTVQAFPSVTASLPARRASLSMRFIGTPSAAEVIDNVGIGVVVQVVDDNDIVFPQQLFRRLIKCEYDAPAPLPGQFSGSLLQFLDAVHAITSPIALYALLRAF